MTKKYSFGNGESREKLHSEIAFGDNLIFPAQIEDLPLKKGSLAEIPKTGFQEVIKLILLSGLTLFFGTEVLGGHLLDEPVRFLFSLIQTLHLFHQNEAEIVLGVSGGSYYIDGETMFASRGENVDSAGLHCWSGFVWMPTSSVEGARVTEAARSGPQPKSLIMPREKSLPFHFGRDFFCIKPPCFEHDGVFI
jgi:hypothetical protein